MCSRILKVPTSSCNPFFHSLDRDRNSLPDTRWISDYNQSCLPQKDIIDPTQSASTRKRFSICPNCSFTIHHTPTSSTIQRRGTLTKPPTPGSGSLPQGIYPAALLDSSPTPQLLLSADNTVKYANKCATRLLDRVFLSDGDPVASPPRLTRPTGGKNSWTSSGTAPIPEHYSGIEGLHVEDLPIELARSDINKWITLDQVLKNIKYTMEKQHEQVSYGFDAGAYADFYAGSGKRNYDYYGDQDNEAGVGGKSPGDGTHKEMIPVVITRRDGELLSAYLYLSIIRSPSNSSTFLALSIVPKSDHVDASFDSITRKPTTQRRRAKSQSKNIIAGTVGSAVLDKVAKLKDMILDEMEFSFTAMTPDGDTILTNRACRELLGEEALKPPAEVEGYDWISHLDIWRPDFSERLPFSEWCINKLFTEEKPSNSTVGIWQGDEKKILDIKGSLLWENPEKKEGLLAGLTVLVDQTERENRERDTRRSAEVRRKFLMNLSRGLKSPIAGIVGLLELLYEIQTGKEQRTIVRQIFNVVNSLLLVLNDLIDFNKMEANDLKVDQKIFILQDLVKDIETLFTQNMAKKGVKFLVDMTKVTKSAFGDGTQLLLKGDEGKMRRVIINLLSNAYKFTSEGEIWLKVATQKVQKGSVELRFEIKDTGIGISEEHQKKLFLPFQDIASNDVSTGSHTTGFGLTIAKSFANFLRGDVGCESVIDKGSTFWFVLPCTRPASDSEITVQRNEDSLAQHMGAALTIGDLHSSIRHDDHVKPKVSIVGANVLVVEDNWSHQAVTERRLQKMGCNVQVAVNGQSAISMMKKGEINADIILMDLQMPLLDGFETTAMIREAKFPGLVAFKDIPIVAVTATEMTGDRDRAKEAGMNDFTLKPLNNDTLKQIIERFLDPEATTRTVYGGSPVLSFSPLAEEVPTPGSSATDGEEKEEVNGDLPI